MVLGLITTKDAKLESIDELRRRIDEAARFVPLENLSISPQCGFASTAAGNLLTIDDQWRKLELVVETARSVWGKSRPGLAAPRLITRRRFSYIRDFFFRIAPSRITFQ